jgi:hypothetical protein
MSRPFTIKILTLRFHPSDIVLKNVFSHAMSEVEQLDDAILAVSVSDDDAESTWMQPRLKKARHERGSRMIVDSLHHATLTAAYHKYLYEYCNERKRATKQIIPSKVWALMYEEYCSNTKTTRVNDSIHWSTRLYSRRLNYVYGGEPVPSCEGNPRAVERGTRKS